MLFRSLETVLEYGLRLAKGRVFLDLWDLETMDPKETDRVENGCPDCVPLRLERLRVMNLTQRPVPSVSCNHDGKP